MKKCSHSINRVTKQRGRRMSDDHFWHMVDALRAKNPNPSPRALYLRRLRERHSSHLFSERPKDRGGGMARETCAGILKTIR